MSALLDRVDHLGEVVKVSDGSVSVSIQRQSHCAGCKAQSICGMDTSASTELVIRTSETYKVGDRVCILMERSLGFQALLLGYVAPFVVVLAVLTVLIAFGISEGLAGLLSLATLVPYYTCLYLVRNRLANRFTFQVQRL